jgi:hypothetical protein
VTSVDVVSFGVEATRVVVDLEVVDKEVVVGDATKYMRKAESNQKRTTGIIHTGVSFNTETRLSNINPIAASADGL